MQHFLNVETIPVDQSRLVNTFGEWRVTPYESHAYQGMAMLLTRKKKITLGDYTFHPEYGVGQTFTTQKDGLLIDYSHPTTGLLNRATLYPQFPNQTVIEAASFCPYISGLPAVPIEFLRLFASTQGKIKLVAVEYNEDKPVLKGRLVVIVDEIM